MVWVSSSVVLIQPQEVSSIGQDEHETLETLFQNVDLSIAETQAWECFHTKGPGRPPRSPLGLLRAFIVMRMKEIRSLRELSRILDVDLRLRRICLIEEGERGYPRSVLSRFTKRVGADRLRRIIDEKVVMLLRRSGVREVDVVLDASFIKAWSIRDPRDGRRGYSDPDARVGRHDRGYDLGYKLHVSLEPGRIIPLSSVMAPANENEKRHGPTLVERVKRILRRAGARLRSLVADSQYSSGRMRGLVDEAVIPYMSNQRRGEPVLRVDRRFRTHGPEEERAGYRKRPAVEAAYAFLKTQYGMTVNKVRGLGRVAVYALYSLLCHVLTREAAENMGRPEKAVSPTFFNT
jgi:transposase